jgi:hypothetical protein
MSFITIIAPTGAVITIRNAVKTAVVSNRTINTANPVYQFAAGATDLTGYTVESNYNIAVFSSNLCGAEATTGGCDHNYEQIYPTYTARKPLCL